MDYSGDDDQSHNVANEYHAGGVDLDTRYVHGQETVDEFNYEEEGVLGEDEGVPEM